MGDIRFGAEKKKEEEEKSEEYQANFGNLYLGNQTFDFYEILYVR